MNKNTREKIAWGLIGAAALVPFGFVTYDAYQEYQILPYRQKIENLVNDYEARTIATRSIFAKKIKRQTDSIDCATLQKDSLPANVAQEKIEHALHNIDSLITARDSVLDAELTKYLTAREGVTKQMNAIHKHNR